MPTRTPLAVGLSVLILFACEGGGAVRTAASVGGPAANAGAEGTDSARPGDWRRGGTCYEIFLRSFFDSDGDGVGDLAGVVEKLDYLNDGKPASGSDLGVRCIWLMPINPSPSYHGYDVADYYGIDPEYGDLQAMRTLVRAAHQRGVAVLMDLVVNHTSSEHPFFVDALNDPESPYRDWYIFRDRPGPANEYGDSNWHRSPVRDEFYYGFFWSGMPDLNWDSDAVRNEMKAVATFWLRDVGVDGFRLDAVRHLAEEERDGTLTTTNVTRTHEALRDLGAHVRSVAPQAFTIGEVFDSTSALRPYYPDQLDAYFGFEVANAILSAVSGGGASQLMRKVLEAEEVSAGRTWAPFLRNHDQSRTMTVLAGDLGRARLAASLLLTLPGLPFVFYGEEIGMTGDKPDERIRTPMHWTSGRAAGFTTGAPWQPLQGDSLTANVGAQDADRSSLLNHYRQLIHLRAETPALGAGEFVPLQSGTDEVAAFLRRSAGEAVMVIANLSTRALREVTLTSEAGTLPSGQYEPSGLIGGPSGAPLDVDEQGRFVGYRPLDSLAPRTAYLFRVGR